VAFASMGPPLAGAGWWTLAHPTTAVSVKAAIPIRERIAFG
jgi:hypothetical protein